MGKTISRVKCASDVIAAVKELGQEGERDFSYIHQVALNQEAVEKERKLRSPGEEHEEKKTFTPGTLKSLLPPAPQAMANRNPILKRYQAFYPGHVDGFLDTKAATWDGVLRNLTEFQALKQCLIDFLWAKHLILHPDDAAKKPTDQQIKDVIESFDASTGFVAGHEPAASSKPDAKAKSSRGRGRAMAKSGTEPVPKRARGRGRGG